ncbi:glycosyltransferase family 4 protein [Halotalea alkalilenta]|uniref:Glycosyl transferase family 1 n=1 Tax=Halotalea alkalilenta TaxID=376489 RepID=A0A172YGI9_9GAMM|nr:glycosyltransferase family 4 protein [Halotalea alkalilenta]ANF58401.1 hypothetical protein A5892_13740 [Halotalea alkalilenta]
MRIAHIITRLIRGGADENTLLSCNAQAEHGHEVYLIYGDEVRQEMLARLDPRIHKLCVGSLRRAISPVHEIKATVEMVRLLRRIRPDIVHTHTSKAGILGRVAARVAGVKGIVHGVHILPFLNVGRVEKITYLVAERALVPFTDKYVNVSQGMMTAGIESNVGKPEKHLVIPSGMDIDKFRTAAPLSAAEVLQHFDVPDQNIDLVLMVAALEPRKRVYEFLDVFKRIVEGRPSACFAVLGEGIDRQRVEQRLVELGLQGRVALLGFRDDVERWIKSARVCVLSSEREGLPRVVVQYALGGSPAVVTALPGVEVIVKNGLTGFTVPIDDIPQMERPILDLLNDEELNARMRANVQALDLEPWGVEHMTSELEKVYSEVLA